MERKVVCDQSVVQCDYMVLEHLRRTSKAESDEKRSGPSKIDQGHLLLVLRKQQNEATMMCGMAQR